VETGRELDRRLRWWRGGGREREAMKSNRNLSRAEGRRLGNVALIAFMVGSLLLLSLIRAKFSPIGTLIAMAFAAGFFLCS
jgi:hypothetical protein